ncbi:MAG: LuxR C-terminal-related transcriptional regulator [Chlamydiales bacterium]|nr:LuxR C-terminal-related transcriptional regulator [Chlamydiales bacterium]
MSKKVQEANIRLIRDLFEGMLDPAEIKRWDRFYEPMIRLHGPASGSCLEHDLASAKEFNLRLAEVFSKGKLEVLEMFANEDKVVICWRMHAIQKIGDKTVVIGGNSIYRLHQGKIVEVWQAWDRLGMLEQLGEIRVCSRLVDLQSNYDTLKKLGMEKYLQQAANLTLRERQCLQCLLKGKTAKETATLLKLSFRTVEYYLENIKGKLDCSNKRDLFATAQILHQLDLI